MKRTYLYGLLAAAPLALFVAWSSDENKNDGGTDGGLVERGREP